MDKKMATEQTPPPPSSLPKAVVKQSKSFLAYTTLHGAQHVSNDSRHTVGRTIWLLFVLTMTGWLLTTLSQLYIRYMTFPYTTTLSVSQQDFQPLPAISVCLSNPIDAERLRAAFPETHKLLELFLLRRESLNWTDPTVLKAMENVTLQQVMHQASFGLQEIVVRALQGYNTPINITSRFLVQDIFVGFELTRCYTFNGVETEPEGVQFSLLDALTLYLRQPPSTLLPFTDVSGFQINVHDRQELPMSFLPTPVAFGTSVSLALRPQKFRYLPAPYYSLGGKDCLKTEDPGFQSQLGTFPAYTEQNCVWENVYNRSSQRCGCKTIGDLGNNNLPHCSLLQIQECYLPTLINSSVLFFAKAKLCTPVCFTTLMQTFAKAAAFPDPHFVQYEQQRGQTFNFTKEDSAKVAVRFDTNMIVLTEHIPALTLDDIYSEVGGQMGLFLGASILTVTELAEHLCWMFWTCLQHVCNRKKTKIGQP